MIKQQLYKL